MTDAERSGRKCVAQTWIHVGLVARVGRQALADERWEPLLGDNHLHFRADPPAGFLVELRVAPRRMQDVQAIGLPVVLTQKDNVKRCESDLLVGANIARHVKARGW